LTTTHDKKDLGGKQNKKGHSFVCRELGANESFLFNRIREEDGTGSAWKQGDWWGGGKEGWGHVAQTMYTYVSKCKNDKRKKKKQK
jgi:hypothetical protein